MKKISVIIPTLNAEEVLTSCLKSISIQNYDMDSVEILVCDGGSTDKTTDIAHEYGAKVLENKLKTGESGKAVGVKAASGEYIALIDSDNILPSKEWFNQMIKPLEKNPNVVGSEPWKYTLRKDDGFITRYSALIGMNDPLVMFLGNYDRINTLTGKWTEVPHVEQDKGDYLIVTLDKRGIPTIGANGTVFRSTYLKKGFEGDYLFDIDIIAKTINDKDSVDFIKVKNGIIHTFCESDVGKFARKQRRRVRDYLYHSEVLKDRVYDWKKMDIKGNNPLGLAKFIFYCLSFFPLIGQSLIGYIKKPDLSWFFHPLACYITLWEYGWGRLIGLLSLKELNRENWKQ